MFRGRGRARGRGRSGVARAGRGRFGRGRGRGSPARADGKTDESDYEEDAWDGDEEDEYYDDEEGVEYEEEEVQGQVESTEPAARASANEIEVDFRSDMMYDSDEDSFLPNTFSREPVRVARDESSSVRVEPSRSQSPRRVRFSNWSSIEA